MGKIALPIVLRINSGIVENLTTAENDALELAISVVRKSATTHTHDVSDIIDGAIDAEAALIERGVPATHRVGIRYICRHRGPGASSYGHKVIASEYTIVRRRDCWRLENYVRVNAMPGDREKRSFEASENVREFLIKNAIAGFTFVDEKASVDMGRTAPGITFTDVFKGLANAANELTKLEPAA